ncbi:hypothetical protein EMCRGX_G025363 [Ephydatia muelleri]|eukprot:Em0021g211a
MDIHARIRLVRLIVVLGLSVATCRALLDCNFTSRQSSETTTFYTFYCDQMCSRWMLYLLDYATPLNCCNYKLPCTVNSKSLEANSVTARRELNFTSTNGLMYLSVTTGRLMLVAQCVSSSGYTNGVMVRVEGSVPAGQPGTTCMPPTPIQSPTRSFQGPVPMPSQTALTSAKPLDSTKLGNNEITSAPFYTVPPQLNLLENPT